jgi:CBS domain-containing protein
LRLTLWKLPRALQVQQNVTRFEAVTPPSVLALDYAKSHGRRVAELMSEDIISANEDTPLSELANILEKHRIKRVPILRDGKLVGIVFQSHPGACIGAP